MLDIEMKINNIQTKVQIFNAFLQLTCMKIINTRLLGRFTPIFYLNCEHVLFVYILKQRRKKFCGFLKKNLKHIFLNFYYS